MYSFCVLSASYDITATRSSSASANTASMMSSTSPSIVEAAFVINVFHNVWTAVRLFGTKVGIPPLLFDGDEEEELRCLPTEQIHIGGDYGLEH